MPDLATLISILDLAVKDRAQLALENAVLRHQLAVLKRSVAAPKIEDSDRIVWIMMRRLLKDWKNALVFVKPDTVVRWHRLGFRYYWKGAAYVYERKAGVWVELGELASDDPKANARFGSGVSVSGTTAVIGARAADGLLPNSGAAYVHSLIPPIPQLYCTPKINSAGCSPTIQWQGVPPATDPLPFLVDASEVMNNKNGLMFYSVVGKAAVPFQGGFLCVNPPVRRTPIQNSGGNPPPNDCSGIFSFDFNARIQSGVDPALAAGGSVYAQYWYRDPAVASSTGLTGGLEFGIGF